MGSGLSMASVNKIKELANAREYGLALDILDSQDLSKSLNPQFLRLCGYIYMYNGRYRDARHILLMAHRLAPEAKRVIYTIICLYLKMGYRTLAGRYYDIYMADADETVPETKQVMYVYNKALGMPIDELEHFIAPAYSNTMDYEWTYETILIYLLQNKKKEAETLAQLYEATYKDSEYGRVIRELIDQKGDVESRYYVYAREERLDDEPEQDDDRILEAGLLEADDLRIHPKEPEIMIMVDDHDEDEQISKRKLKRKLREQERMENDKNGPEYAETSDADSADISGDDHVKGERKNFIKNIFLSRKKSGADADKAVAADTAEADADKADDTEAAGTSVIDKPVYTEAVKSAAITEHKDEPDVEAQERDAAYREARSIFFGESDAKEDTASLDEHTDGDDDMHELHLKEHNVINRPVVKVDMGDDDFTAESETIDEMKDEYGYGNPFDSMTASGNGEAKPGYSIKKSISFEAAELADIDDTSEYEVDDFSELDNDESSEFGKMTAYETEVAETEYEAEAEEAVAVEIEPETEPEYEAEAEETVAVETEPETEAEDEAETEEAVAVETEPETEAEYEAEAEEAVAVETEPETEAEDEAEAEEAVAAETEPETEPEFMYEQDIDALFKVPPRKKLDFPVFKSSLFPDYHKDEPVIENHFNEILQESQDKIQENILKEEQMQREAEELLASLGIDIESMAPVTGSMAVDGDMNNEPSRDDLKASLKINSVQKNVLSKLKEYR